MYIKVPNYQEIATAEAERLADEDAARKREQAERRREHDRGMREMERLRGQMRETERQRQVGDDGAPLEMTLDNALWKQLPVGKKFAPTLGGMPGAGKGPSSVTYKGPPLREI